MYEVAPDGSIVPHYERYVELCTGLNHLLNGQYVPSSDRIVLSPNGSEAFGTNCQHQAYFPSDIASGVIKLVTPAGLQLASRPIALS